MSSTNFRVHEHVVAAQHIREFPGATISSQDDELRLHVKQYTPLRSSGPPDGAVTLIGAHANGFPKELYEPLWDELLERSRGLFEIRSIWIADAAHQGQSYVLNEKTLSDDPSWFDHSRDMLHMINQFRSQMPRPIVGIGHSFGGTQMVNLSLMHPRLFAALVLLDPVIELGPESFNNSRKTVDGTFSIATASTHRRDHWPSRDDAAATFLRNPFYRSWDKRVFDLWLRHGLRELPTALYPGAVTKDGDKVEVTLKTPKHQEVWTYLRPNYGGRGEDGRQVLDRRATPDLGPGIPHSYPFYRAESFTTFHKLPYVRPPVFYILGGASNVSSPGSQRDKVKMTGTGAGGSGGIADGKVADVILAGIGHLVPMEATSATAQEAVRWLSPILEDWREEERSWERWQQSRPKLDHLRVNEDWMKHIGPLPARQPKTAVSKL